MGLNITGKDTEYTYYFSICNNLQKYYYSSYSCMLVQENNDIYHQKRCLVSLSDTTNSIKPTISFNTNNDIQWQFKYNQNITIELICNYSMSALTPYIQITLILEILPNQYLMQISSLYFCPDNNPPDRLGKNQCIWNDTSGAYTLNLTELYDMRIMFETNFNYLYYYYVCADGWYTTRTVYQSCGMYGGTESGVHIWWNSSIIPYFNESINQWRFEYPYNHYIRWICDKTVSLYNVVQMDDRSVTIQSKYACPTSSKTCLFKPTNSGNSLDLTFISGQLIVATDNSLTYSYEYTPCSNNAVCNNMSVMAMRWDIYNRECDTYLALFEGNVNDGYDLYYNISNQQWQFIYYNGEECGSDKDTKVKFNIYWKCIRNASDWEVTKVETINDCLFAMYIQSSLIC